MDWGWIWSGLGLDWERIRTGLGMNWEWIGDGLGVDWEGNVSELGVDLEGIGSGFSMDWEGIGLDVDWVWIGCGLGVDWEWIGSGFECDMCFSVFLMWPMFPCVLSLGLPTESKGSVAWWTVWRVQLKYQRMGRWYPVQRNEADVRWLVSFLFYMLWLTNIDVRLLSGFIEDNFYCCSWNA